MQLKNFLCSLAKANAMLPAAAAKYSKAFANLATARCSARFVHRSIPLGRVWFQARGLVQRFINMVNDLQV